jgi:hypothetical protein
MNISKLVYIAVIVNFSGISNPHLMAQESNRIPLTEKEIPVAPEKMPYYLWEGVKMDSFNKEHLGWKLAFCQHPMYLLIDEDRGEPTVGERIPPWGAKYASDYAERVRRNLNSLDQFPGLILNYQWSAVEFQSLAERFPDILEGMKKHYRNGKLDFIDGSYSQAHLQVLGSESNWRQFEYGLEVYEELIGKRIDLYARQETGLHLQLPQLLKIFGYNYVYFPNFPMAFEIIEGNMEFIATDGRIELVKGDEFIEYVGLDGSVIPSYFALMPGNEEIHKIEFQQDLFGAPKLWTEFPDLAEIDKDVYEHYHTLFDFVRLGDALEERYSLAPPRAKARAYTYWSYTEGVWAEELLRMNKKAEETAMLAEQMNSMGVLAGLKNDRTNEIKNNWKTILKSQHHDISWIEVTDLRRKSINRLDSCITNNNIIITEIAKKLNKKDNSSISVFNGLPYRRLCPVELEGNKSLNSISEFQEFGGKSVGFVEVQPGGFSSFKAINGVSVSKKTDIPKKLETKYYSVEFSEEGLINQLATTQKKSVLNNEEYLGGEIRARINNKWEDNRKAEKQYYSGPVFDVLERETTLGSIPVTEKYFFYKNAPYIKAEIEFDFSGNEVGNMWIDKSKINIYYPTTGEEIYYDIPFGFTEGRPGRPLFPINWLYSNGIVYVNRGTTKHWVEEGLMGNVVAWGSNHFTNRRQWGFWTSRPQYDIRLYGKQKIEYYIIPYDNFDPQSIIRDVECLTAPVYFSTGSGEKSYYQLDNKDLKITAVYSKGEEIWVRGYKIPSGDKSKYRDFEIFNTPLERIISNK